MREIKFRGKGKCKKKGYYDDFIYFNVKEGAK